MIKKGAIIMAAFMASGLSGGNLEHANGLNFWKNGENGPYFHQETVDASKLFTDSIIRAKVDGEWQEFHIRPLPDGFFKWSSESRLKYLKEMEKGIMPGLAGPHNAMVASCGVRRMDSQFRINNAVKGTGFMPKPETIDSLINLLESTKDSPVVKKLQILQSLYSEPDRWFDRTKILSLELYTRPEFETGTFLNEMINPAVAIVYLDYPSYEVKAIAQLLHWNDPQITDYEKKVVKYGNLIHSYFHGEFPMFITVIYHVIEVYNNTPEKEGRGVRVVPPLP